MILKCRPLVKEDMGIKGLRNPPYRLRKTAEAWYVAVNSLPGGSEKSLCESVKWSLDCVGDIKMLEMPDTCNTCLGEQQTGCGTRPKGWIEFVLLDFSSALVQCSSIYLFVIVSIQFWVPEKTLDFKIVLTLDP